MLFNIITLLCYSFACLLLYLRGFTSFSRNKNVKGDIVRILQHQIKVTVGDANLFGGSGVQRENITVGIQHVLPEICRGCNQEKGSKIIPSVH